MNSDEQNHWVGENQIMDKLILLDILVRPCLIWINNNIRFHDFATWFFDILPSPAQWNFSIVKSPAVWNDGLATISWYTTQKCHF